eukprot:TRINITY_DN20947_c0_g1_i2.p1 TRINITY_DN20947_c0_g1~~TRINITY_DN20947_c0_g1_i2.p1  ORF type:complete len:328 (+),score=24.47 TRINITY_DN20947_c0_g1_i2:207-1190(+)
MNENQSQKFFEAEFFRCILGRITYSKNQKLLYKLRELDNESKLTVESSINTVSTDLQKLEQLAKSKFSRQIEVLNISMNKQSQTIDELCFASTKYFPNIQKVNIVFTDSGTLGFNDKKYGQISNCLNKSEIVKEINITQDLSFRGLTISLQNDVKGVIKIYGQHNVTVTDSKFEKFQLYTKNNRNVLIKNCQFLNLLGRGLSCWDCETLKIDQVLVENCNWKGLWVQDCKGEASLSNIQIFGCEYTGIYLRLLPNFKIEGLCVENCGRGVGIYQSVGQIGNVSVKNCAEYGIQLWRGSTVRFGGVDLKENEPEDVFVSEDSLFQRDF